MPRSFYKSKCQQGSADKLHASKVFHVSVSDTVLEYTLSSLACPACSSYALSVCCKQVTCHLKKERQLEALACQDKCDNIL
jgi:hypothetical protein